VHVHRDDHAHDEVGRDADDLGREERQRHGHCGPVSEGPALTRSPARAMLE
jgi:hypothetical protein